MRKILLSLALIASLTLSSAWGGIDLNGDADWLDCEDDSSIQITGDLTISIWVNIDSVSPGDNKTIIILSGDRDSETEANNTIYQLDFKDSNDTLLMLWEYNTGSNVSLASTGTLTTGWHHIAFTRETTGNSYDFYIDGVSAGASTWTNDPTGGSSGHLALGHNYLSGSYPQCWDGKIDEVAIWDKELSLTEIELLAKSKIKRMPLQIQPDNLQGYWALDDYPAGEGTLATKTFVDMSGNGNTCTGVDADNDSDTISEEVLTYP